MDQSMTERERLIKLLDERIAIQECSFSPDKPLTTDLLADYLLDHGIIVPPCKAGDIIYTLTYDGKFYLPLKVTRRESVVRWMDENQFGNALFTTREEAEEALAERRKSSVK